MYPRRRPPDHPVFYALYKYRRAPLCNERLSFVPYGPSAFLGLCLAPSLRGGASAGRGRSADRAWRRRERVVADVVPEAKRWRDVCTSERSRAADRWPRQGRMAQARGTAEWSVSTARVGRCWGQGSRMRKQLALHGGDGVRDRGAESVVAEKGLGRLRKAVSVAGLVRENGKASGVREEATRMDEVC